ncbi:hypothetical protein GTO91_13760 [Heliobacterium undosum]|uniref:DUF4878 domain-containing protein n=1 Tax=Heliomicrobium undosum TaxID=121734 RepID=A0A845L824_9FIRM|nr:hypothetical protein [Heliomicrobium undosum]MZP30780.1 hypothetical protein [Heliomicrobium undosum]
MARKGKLIATAVVTGILTSIVFATYASSSDNLADDKKILTQVQMETASSIEKIKTKQIDKFLENVKTDTRYKDFDKSNIKKQYEELQESNPILDYKIIDTKIIDGSNAELIVEFKYPDGVEKFRLQAVKEKNKWLLVLPGSVVHE